MNKNILLFRGILLTVALCFSVVLTMRFGSVSIGTEEIIVAINEYFGGNATDYSYPMIVLDIRLPRILFAALGGALLSLTGLLMQTVSQNYLADPYILGVSSGASFGAVLCLVSGFAQFFSPIWGIYWSIFRRCLGNGYSGEDRR